MNARPSILILAPDLSNNSVFTPVQFAGALQGLLEPRLVGPASGPAWPPLQEELNGAGVLPGWHPWSSRLRTAVEAASRGCVATYAFKAMPPTLGMGLWLKKHRGLPLLVHLDDWDGGYLAAASPARRAWYGVRGMTSPRGQLYLRHYESRVGQADVVTVSTRALEERFGGRLLRQGVDTTAVNPARYPRAAARLRLGLDPDAYVVLFLGTPRPHKGLDLLPAAVSALARPESGRLVIVGSEPDPLLVGSQRAGGCGLSWFPPCSFEDANWFLAAADALVVPQLDVPYARHQMPAKVLHALAMGTPVVATDVGDLDEVIGGASPAGIVVPPGDAVALAEAVAQLEADAELRSRLGAEGRRRAVSLYGWAAMGRTLGALLEPLGLA